MQTPVALLIFNRPELTRLLVAEVLKARPPKVLVFADGPRPDRPDDVELVRATRAIISEAPWECEVLTNYSDVNLGTKYRPATGLDWVFSVVEQAIFFEDDCLPHPSFFRFCDELLDKYRDVEQVMMISGNNFARDRRFSSDSYVFCHYVGIWGWATWRRAWKHYDVELEQWKTLRETRFLDEILSSEAEVRLWRGFFDRVISGESRTWDHQWQFACWARHGLSLQPAINLVTSLGFGPEAAHFKTFDSKLSVPAQEMAFPLRHPTSVTRSQASDKFVVEELFGLPASPSPPHA